MNRNGTNRAINTYGEALCCAGTLAKHIAEGDLVNIIFMTHGLSSRTNTSATEYQIRNEAMVTAMETQV